MSIGTSDAARELADIKPWSMQASPISPLEYATRIERARSLLEAAEVDALVVTSPDSLYYYTGLNWPASERLLALIITAEYPPIFICPAFEADALEEECQVNVDIRLWQEHECPATLLTDLLSARDLRRVALDPEATFGSVLKLSAQGLTLTDGKKIISACRMRKSPAEAALIRQAMAITLEVHARLARIMQPGFDNRDAATFIDAAHKALGAGGAYFSITSFGRATAFPHGLAQSQTLAEGDMILVDMGCRISGYHSDLTRSYVLGQPTDEQRRIWDIAYEAQQAGFEAADLGAPAQRVDRAVRKTLEKHGLGPGYALPGLPHRTGHGIGVSLHEEPYIVEGDLTELDAGMCFSNEPTIIVPNQFGVRLEDHVLMTAEGATWLTPPQSSLDRPFG